MDYMNFLEIILAAVKEAYGAQFECMSQEDKAAAVMTFAGDILSGHPDIMAAVAQGVYNELNAYYPAP